MWNFEEILPENGDLTEGPAWTGKSLLITDGKIKISSGKFFPHWNLGK